MSASQDEKPQRKAEPKPKTATTVFGETRVIMECPFCGMTLVKSDYDKMCKLLDDCDPPRGKVCTSCGGVSVIRLTSKAKEVLREKLGEGRPAGKKRKKK